MDVGWVLPVCWFGLGLTVVGCSVRAARSRRVFHVGLGAVATLWVVAGAGANLWFLVRGDDFSGFADQASTSFVQDRWESLVVPHHAVFIGLLIAFEATAGAAVLVAGRVRQVGLVLLMCFNVALLSFGWGYLLWSVPLVAALESLRRADQRWAGASGLRTIAKGTVSTAPRTRR
jgi:uncharacterized membrane protein YphA (DoxX/SURF4 family)